jgi:cation:H+ antiporter
VDWLLPLGINAIIFSISAFAVWCAGSQLALTAEEISDRHNLGKEMMGFVFLAAATELPEIVTTMFAAIEAQSALLLNNMFGGIALQTAILAFADMAAIQVAITRFPRNPSPILEGVLLILMLALLHGIILLGDIAIFGRVGVGSVLLALLYVGIIQLLRQQNNSAGWVPIELPTAPATENIKGLLATVGKENNRQLYQRFAVSSLTILVFGVALVYSAEKIATQTGLGTSFIGATLLAGATSLPELSTTIMAVRLHSYSMAISNIFGSNLIMLLLILPADLVYAKGPLLQEADASASFALLCGIVVTAIYVIGLVLRGSRRIFGMGYDSAAVLAVYVCSLGVLYMLR